MIPIKALRNGFRLPVLWLWTWQIGGKMEQDTTNDIDSIDAIRGCINAGITHIDTAELYWAGHTEEIIREATFGYDRSSLFLTSKVKPQNLSFHDCIHACEMSLRRLGTSYLDLYLIHGKNPDIDLAETMWALDELVKRGLVRHIGVSNFSSTSLQYAQNCTTNKIVLNQCHYNLFYREPEVSGLLSYCQENDILLQAWRPLQLGELSCREFPSLQKMSVKYGKTPIQIALQWLISQKNVTTIVKMRSPEHREENLWVFWWNMDPEDVRELWRDFEEQYSVSNREPLL